MEDTFVIDGTLFRFIDTAGLRQSDDTLESIGIERTYQALSQASVVLYLVDVTRTTLADLNKTLYRPTITRSGFGFNYDYSTVVETRSFTSAFLPIPYKEMLNVPGLVQNEGWESWTR